MGLVVSLLKLRLRSLFREILGDVSDTLFAESLRSLELLDILGVMRVLAVTILLKSITAAVVSELKAV